MSHKREHVLYHRRLHESLDEIVADMIRHEEILLSTTNVMDLIKWSASQCDDKTIKEYV